MRVRWGWLWLAVGFVLAGLIVYALTSTVGRATGTGDPSCGPASVDIVRNVTIFVVTCAATVVAVGRAFGVRRRR